MKTHASAGLQDPKQIPRNIPANQIKMAILPGNIPPYTATNGYINFILYHRFIFRPPKADDCIHPENAQQNIFRRPVYFLPPQHLYIVGPAKAHTATNVLYKVGVHNAS